MFGEKGRSLLQATQLEAHEAQCSNLHREAFLCITLHQFINLQLIL